MGGFLDVSSRRGRSGRLQGSSHSGPQDASNRILSASGYISADPDDPGIKQVIDAIGDDNLVVATDFGHPEGRHYTHAVEEVLKLPGVSDASKRKILWDNALKLYPIEV